MHGKKSMWLVFKSPCGLKADAGFPHIYFQIQNAGNFTNVCESGQKLAAQ